MLYDRPLQIADIQILRNYLKHRENAVVASMRICICERWNICRKFRRKCDGVRNRTVNKGSVICVVANPIEKFATRQRLGCRRWKNERQFYKGF